MYSDDKGGVFKTKGFSFVPILVFIIYNLFGKRFSQLNGPTKIDYQEVNTIQRGRTTPERTVDKIIKRPVSKAFNSYCSDIA